MTNHERAKERFWISLDLKHPDWNPDSVTTELGIQPWRTTRATATAKTRDNVWRCEYKEGVSDADFDEALENLLQLCEGHSRFFKEFSRQGVVTVTINKDVMWDEGILLSLRLGPDLLHVLSLHGIALRVQAWSAQMKDQEIVA